MDLTGAFVGGLITGIVLCVVVAAGLWKAQQSRQEVPEEPQPKFVRREPQERQPRARKHTGNARVTEAHLSQPRRHWNPGS